MVHSFNCLIGFFYRHIHGIFIRLWNGLIVIVLDRHRAVTLRKEIVRVMVFLDLHMLGAMLHSVHIVFEEALAYIGDHSPVEVGGAYAAKLL